MQVFLKNKDNMNFINQQSFISNHCNKVQTNFEIVIPFKDFGVVFGELPFSSDDSFEFPLASRSMVSENKVRNYYHSFKLSKKI